MVNRTWLVTVGVLSGLVIGASTVKADTDTNVNNEPTSAVVTNVNTQNADKVSTVTNSNGEQQTTNSAAPTTSQTSNEQQEQHTNAQVAVTNTDNNVTVSTPKATYYYPNQWYESSDGSWSYFKGDEPREIMNGYGLTAPGTTSQAMRWQLMAGITTTTVMTITLTRTVTI